MPQIPPFSQQDHNRDWQSDPSPNFSIFKSLTTPMIPSRFLRSSICLYFKTKGRMILGSKIIILLMKEHFSNEYISSIVQKPYEIRTQTEHRILSQVISASLVECTMEMARKLSCFVEQLTSEECKSSQHTEPSIGSLLLVRNEETSSDRFQLLRSTQNFQNPSSPTSSLTLVIPQKALRRCQVLGTAEQQVKNMQASEYFEQVPKKRLYAVFRQAEVVLLGYGELLYEEETEKNDVFFARKGEFSYQVKDQDKNIELLTFKQGHLFSKTPFEVEEGYRHRTPQSKNHLNVRCKSSKGILFRFSRQFFMSYLMFYCQNILRANSDRLNTLLKQRAELVKEARKPNSHLLTRRLPRSISVELQTLRDSKASTARKGPLPKEPQLPIDISNKPHDYRTLKSSQPPRNKLYTRNQLAKLSLNPQQNESDVLLWKKSRCLRVMELTHRSQHPLPKAETMLEFIKSTIHFQKTRRKPSIL